VVKSTTYVLQMRLYLQHAGRDRKLEKHVGSAGNGRVDTGVQPSRETLAVDL